MSLLNPQMQRMMIFLRQVFHVAAVRLKLKNESVDILIIDNENADIMCQTMPAGAIFKVLEVRKKTKVLREFSIEFLWEWLTQILATRTIRRSMLHALIKSFNPKVVITSIDNTTRLNTLREAYPGISLFSVQNGVRWGLSRPEQDTINFGHYYCFGDCEKDIIASGGHQYDSINSVGSLRLSVFMQRAKAPSQIHRICFISQLSTGSEQYASAFDRQTSSAYTTVTRELFSVLDNFAARHRIPLVVAARGAVGTELFVFEKKFFLRNAESNVTVHPRRHDYSSYELAFHSRLIVTISSTLGYEMLGVGKRVIFAKDYKQASDLVLQGAWSENYETSMLPIALRLFDDDSQTNAEKIGHIFNMSENGFQDLISTARNYYMNFRPAEPVNIVIANHIDTILSESRPMQSGRLSRH